MIFKSNDDTVVSRSDFSAELQPGMTVEMSIVLHEQAEDRHVTEWSRCPRCNYVDNGVVAGSGWLSW